MSFDGSSSSVSLVNESLTNCTVDDYFYFANVNNATISGFYIINNVNTATVSTSSSLVKMDSVVGTANISNL
jgi:hypothetical protein